MNENLNLVEILKDCPKGTKLYSPLVGEVELVSVSTKTDDKYPIWVTYCHDDRYVFTKDGRYEENAPDGECLLFPSKKQRDWSKFKPKKPKFDPNILNPYDRVLIRDISKGKWCCSLFSHIDNELRYHNVCIYGLTWKCCIPYNEETKHLVGTTEEAPEFYRYWED